MRVDSLTLLLAFIAICSLVSAWCFARDKATADRKAAHYLRLHEAAVDQRDQARRERDRAMEHATSAQLMVDESVQDARHRHPSTMPVERERLDPRLARHLHVTDAS